MLCEELKNRLAKNVRLIAKWAKRHSVSCFRVYDKDLPNYPLIVDYYDGVVVAWLFERKRDETMELKQAFYDEVYASVLAAFECEPENVFVKYRQKQRGVQNQYEKLGQQAIVKRVTENGLMFEVNFSDYLDVGLFLDHRYTRQWVREQAKEKRVLNLFAYTGSFSCYAAAGAAVSTTTVDMNKGYVAWAQRNMMLNGFEGRSCDRFVEENCFSFLKQETSRNRYDLIICDPPTFSQSKQMKHCFSVNEDYVELVQDCLRLLAPGGKLMFSTNSKTFKFDPSLFPGVDCKSFVAKGMKDFERYMPHRAWLISR